MRSFDLRLSCVVLCAGLLACGAPAAGDDGGVIVVDAGTSAEDAGVDAGVDAGLPPGLSANLTLGTRKFDVFLPSTPPTRAVVLLHGGGGNKEMLEANLDLPTATQSRLDALGVAWIFPQGLTVGGNAYTWNNRVMTSGVDDVAFLTELASWAKQTLGVTNLTLGGHSNGGMMTHRMWCEVPAVFDRYVALAGPSSKYYRPVGGAACTGGKPFMAIVGDGDLVLQTPGNLAAPTWTIANFLVAASAPGSFVDPDVLNEVLAHASRRMGSLCPTEALATPVETTRKTSWTNCGGQVVTWLIKAQATPTGLGNHPIDKLESDGDFVMADALAAWAKQ